MKGLHTGLHSPVIPYDRQSSNYYASTSNSVAWSTPQPKYGIWKHSGPLLMSLRPGPLHVRQQGKKGYQRGPRRASIAVQAALLPKSPGQSSSAGFSLFLDLRFISKNVQTG